MIAVMVDPGGGDAQGSERGLEYDTMSGRYAEFIESEVLPKIAHDYNITFTTDPEGRATMGGSSGGAAALYMAWYHPEWYHRVLTYSGTYVNQQSPLNPENLPARRHGNFMTTSSRKARSNRCEFGWRSAKKTCIPRIPNQPIITGSWPTSARPPC